jgi:hypothetical protein
VDQHADAGDDEDHHHRQLVELQGDVDVEGPGRHPLEEREHVRGVHGVAGAAHREEDRDREPEGEDQHAGADERHQAGGRMARGVGRVVPMGVVRAVPVLPGMPVRMPGRRGIRRSRHGGRAQREEPVEQEAEQGQHRQQPREARDGVRQRMPGSRKFCWLVHQPFSRLMSSRFTDWR